LARPASTGVRFAARKLPANDPAAFVEQSIVGAPNRYEARLTLRAGADEIARRFPAHWGTVKPLDAHTCEYRTGDDDLRWLALRVAMLGVDFEVHEPPEPAGDGRGRRRAPGRDTVNLTSPISGSASIPPVNRKTGTPWPVHRSRDLRPGEDCGRSEPSAPIARQATRSHHSIRRSHGRRGHPWPSRDGFLLPVPLRT